jgi:putative ABC transport system permease protein
METSHPMKSSFDLSKSLRRLIRRPAVSAAVIVCLALGIGANTAVFSLVDTVLLADLPFAAPERVMAIWGEVPTLDVERQPWSGHEFLDFRQQARSFEHLAALRSSYLNLTGDGPPERLLAAVNTPELFSILGIDAVEGRLFGLEDERDGELLVVLSESFWRSRFGSDPAAVGRSIRLNDQPHTILGVVPDDVNLGFGQQYQIWLPLSLDRATLPQRSFRGLSVLGLVAPGVDRQAAQAEMTSIIERFAREFPDLYPADSGFAARLSPITDEVVGDLDTKLLVLFGFAALVLLIACVNVINLLLAQATVRQRELALRVALGAQRGDLVRGLLAESLILSLVGGLAGLGLAVVSLRLFLGLDPGSVPRLDEVSIDLRMLAFTLGVSVLVGIVAGLVPALRASRPDLQSTFKEGEEGRSTAGGAGQRLRNALVIAEVTLATVALIGAGLMIRSYLEVRQVPPGFDPDDVLTFQIFLSPQTYPERHLYEGFYRQLLDRLDSTPGVADVGTVNELPLGSRRFAVGTELEGYVVEPGQAEPTVDWRPASPGYFEAMDIPLVAGRGFLPTDDAEGAPVAIVDQNLVDRYWPGQPALGRRLKLTGRPGNVAVWRTVVGVVGGVKSLGLEATAREQVYTPYPQAAFPYFSVVVETETAPEALMGDVRQVVWSLDPDQPIEALQPMAEILDQSLAARRSFAWLMGAFGLVALLLTAVGVYGIVTYTVTQRTSEIGIRMALGAERRSIVRMVVGRSLAVTALGVLAGIVLALLGSRLVTDLLFGTGPSDPFTFVAAAALLFALTALASYRPTRRALAVDPVTSLRQE